MGSSKQRGVRLGDLTWMEAERVLLPESIVVLPIGAGSKEHGPHLLLKNDLLLAEYLAERILRASDVVVAPTVPYHHYPAFAAYPGSTSLRFDTARELTVDVCRSLAHFGPRRFYALNTGVSTVRPLEAASRVLEGEGIALRYTDLVGALKSVEGTVALQQGGSHADEIETSMMLFIAPETVDMKKAVKDFHEGSGPLTRDPNGSGTYSPSGVWGDATLATREKGEMFTEVLVARLVRDIEDLRRVGSA